MAGRFDSTGIATELPFDREAWDARAFLWRLGAFLAAIWSWVLLPLALFGEPAQPGA